MPGRFSDRVWAPLFACLYDRMNARGEDAGLRDLRRGLLARARGRTLEVGAGTGANLALYPSEATELVLTEPDAHMRAQLEAKGTEVVAASAESLPFPDASFDTAVATLVLCSAADQAPVLRELARVLRPSGSLLFLEHVRSDDPRVARRQDRWERPWSWIGRGCHPNRNTLAAIRAAGFEVVDVAHEALESSPAIVRPLIVGETRRP